MNSLSILPLDYDIDYLIAQSGVTNHFGHDVEDDGIHFRYLLEDYDAVQAAIAAYPFSYANDVKKAKLWEDVKAIRAAKEALPAPTLSGPVDNDDASKIKILGLVQMAVLSLQAGTGFEEEFTLADNTVALLDAPAAIMLGKAAGHYISTVYKRARELRNAINAATNLDELALIDINSGWPA